MVGGPGRRWGPGQGQGQGHRDGLELGPEKRKEEGQEKGKGKGRRPRGGEADREREGQRKGSRSGSGTSASGWLGTQLTETTRELPHLPLQPRHLCPCVMKLLLRLFKVPPNFLKFSLSSLHIFVPACQLARDLCEPLLNALLQSCKPG